MTTRKNTPFNSYSRLTIGRPQEEKRDRATDAGRYVVRTFGEASPFRQNLIENTPERRLWASVVARAGLDYSDILRRRDREQMLPDDPEDLEYIHDFLFVDDPTLGSLYWISEYIATDPDYFREAVRDALRKDPHTFAKKNMGYFDNRHFG